jgi:predicted house-cleaning noncanonical NTP pyrophosphatase (MazG superfamily)/predicted kinase
VATEVGHTLAVAEKLIRDRVPGLYGRSATDPAYRVADTSEMFDLLITKLREETEELAASRDPEELADILEVARALADAIGSTQATIEDIRRAKVERAGAFDERIVWREAPADASSVLILTGPPGSGKSTVAQLVAERITRSVHLESDLFFHWIVGGYVEPWLPESHDQNTFVMRLVGDVAAAYAEAGYFTIVDGMLLPDWFYVPVTNALTSAGLNVATVILRPSLEVCLERASSRPERPLVDRAVIEKLWNEFDDLSDLDAVAIDNAKQTPDETAEQLIRSNPVLLAGLSR